MAGSMNRVTLIGHVGADPEVRTTTAGGKVASLRLATSERWTDKASGEKREVTDWHSIVIWNEALVGVVERFVRKGAALLVEGKLKTRKWTDKTGAERWTTEVILQGFDGQVMLLDKAGAGAGNRPPPADSAPAGRGAGGPAGGGFGGSPRRDSAGKRADPLDDDIPF